MTPSFSFILCALLSLLLPACTTFRPPHAVLDDAITLQNTTGTLRLTDSDCANLAATLESTPSYETKGWRNEQNISFSVSPRPVHHTESGAACREALLTITEAEKKERFTVLGCKEGSIWKISPSPATPTQ